MNLFPIVAFDLIDDARADQALNDWGRYLGQLDRPYGRHSFGLFLHGELLCVAVSASTTGITCGGYRRQECVELARLVTHPEHRELTRVGLRLWRVVAPGCWAREYWAVRACVSYSNRNRHCGDIYRFDGWRKVKDVPGGKTGPNAGHNPSKQYEPKSVWVFEVQA